jgi:hypothetical protein
VRDKSIDSKFENVNMFLKRDLESGEVLEEVRAQAPSPKPHSNAITWNQFLDCTEGRWLEPNPHDE